MKGCGFHSANPGDRILAATPMNGTPEGTPRLVEVVLGGNSAAFAGETYHVLLSRTIPVIEGPELPGEEGAEQAPIVQSPQQRFSSRRCRRVASTTGWSPCKSAA